MSSAQHSSCPLCARHNEQVLWHNSRARVIAVDDPNYPGMVRVIWNQHVSEMTDLPEPEQLALMRLVFFTERLMREVLAPDKVNLASLGNQVPHLHWHVIPRWRDDPCFPGSIWSAAKAAATADANHSTASDSQRRAQARHDAANQYWLALGEQLADFVF